MKQEDEEFEKLLGEIPHATHDSLRVEGLGSSGTTPAGCTIRNEVPSKSTASHNSPFLGSEAFGELLQAFQVVDDLQQCGEFHHSPSHLGLMASIANEGISKFPCNIEDPDRHPLMDQEEEEPLAALGFAESHSHKLPDDSLITMFSKMNLEIEMPPRHSLQAHDENRSFKMTGDGGASNEVIKVSAGLYKPLGVTECIPVDSGMGAMASTVSNTSTILPRKLNIPAHLSSNSNDHSFNKPFRHDTFDSRSCSNARHASANSAMVFEYANGLPSTQSRSMNNSFYCSRNHVNPSLYADARAQHHRAMAFSNSNGMSGHINERDLSVYFSGSSLDQDIGSTKLFQGAEMADGHQALLGSFYNMQSLPQEVEATANHVHSLGIEQDVHQDFSVASFFQAQKVCKMQLMWQRKEEERQRMQQILDYHSQALGCMQHYGGPPPPLYTHTFTVPSLYTGRGESCRPLQTRPTTSMMDWRLQFYQGDTTRLSSQDLAPQSENHCTFFTQGFCSRGEICPVLHSHSRSTVRSRDFKLSPAPPFGKVMPLASQEKQPTCPVKILSRKSSRAAPALLTSSCLDGNREATSNGHMNGDASAKVCQPTDLISAKAEKQRFSGAGIDSSGIDLPRAHEGKQPPQVKYTTLAEIEGHIYAVAKDQHGCRFLQRQFDEGGPQEVQKIFSEIIDHILELMTDPFGNYLVQKLLEVCNEDQRLKILGTTTIKGELINASLNMHGTRAVQKLIETLTSSQQVSMVTASLRSGVVILSKDLNGNHVVQRCLQHLSNEDSQFIFEAVTSHCVEVATHRHGCCVLQRCIDFSKGVSQQQLIAEIAANSCLLSQDPFGNYVVQYVLDLGMSWATKKVMEQLAGNYTHLSMQKFSSNVVEKCLKIADEEQRIRIVHELMKDPHLSELLQDSFANYVIQSALVVSKGTLHASLVEAICPHTPLLLNSPYGKRILSRRNLKKC